MKKNKKHNSNKNSKQTRKVTTKEPWYNNTLFVLIMLITVFPLGLFLVLKNERLKQELWPSLKVIIVCAIAIIAFVFFTGDWEKPVLEVKDNVIYSINDEFGTDVLINDFVTKVEDNETPLSVEDVNIVKYDDLDFEKVGTQEITFLVKDEAANVATKTAKLTITE